jgi:ABC-type multidrug transport system ATPase subunit
VEVVFELSESNKLTWISFQQGSGKTTLLNAIAGRLDSTLKVRGKINFNGKKSSSSVSARSIIGYVTQFDNLLPNLTVRETLQYSALLRLPDSIPKHQKLLLVSLLKGILVTL